MKLEKLEGEYSVCRLSPDTEIPNWASSVFTSITRSENELSIVCRSDAIPKDIRREDNWEIIRVAGELDFGMVGVIAKISTILSDAGIPIFVISSFDTDYVLVKNDQTANAIGALVSSGYTFLNVMN